MVDMLGVALSEVQGLLNDLFEKLSGKDWEEWLGELKKFLRKEPCWNGVAKPNPSIFEPVGAVVIPATTGKFVAKDKFVVNTKRNASVKISAVWDSFTSWFLSGDGKTEDPTSEQTLRYHKLRKSSVDGPIITELGGEEKSETTLTEMFFLMEKKKNGENGVLLNNGYANIFYIRDQAGVLRAVDVDWGGGGWCVWANSALSPLGWRVGDQVFSRKSDLGFSEPSALAQA